MDNNKDYKWDLIVLGGGPGGYTAALEGANKGLKVLLIEKNNLGGVCLNEGCVPTKTMLHSAHIYEKINQKVVKGLSCPDLIMDQVALQSWKNNVVTRFRKGVEGLMKGNKIAVIEGDASFSDDNTIQVGSDHYTGEYIVIATGASPIVPPIPGVDQAHVYTSKEFLELESIPSPFAVIGGGVIGLEIGSLCAAMGKEVHIIEMEESLLGGLMPEISNALVDSLHNCSFHLGTRVESIESDQIVCSHEGEKICIPAAGVLVSTGRKANIDSLNLKSVRIATGPKGIAVNEKMQTSIPRVYAIGDVTGLVQLAHAASRMGEIAVDNICGRSAWFEEDKIPWVVYTSPEAAGCGFSKEKALEEGYEPVKAKFKMVNTARFYAENGDAPGWVCLTADKKTGQILGIEMLGNGCSEMIFGGALMVQSELTVDDLIATVFPHPTVSESIRECSLILKKKLNKG